MFSSYTILFAFAVAVLPVCWLLNAFIAIYFDRQMKWREYHKASALKIDITANEFFPALWRRVFSKSKQTERFGITGQTVAAIIGDSQMYYFVKQPIINYLNTLKCEK